MRARCGRGTTLGALLITLMVGGACASGCDWVLGIDRVEVGCFTGERKCSDNNTPQECDVRGAWKDATAGACVGQTCHEETGTCIGICERGKRRCIDNWKQTCDENGEWTDLQECPVGLKCQGGECVVDCQPGDLRCYDNRRQSCNGDGEWQDEEDCDDSASACSLDRCIGTCVPDRARCDGDTPQGCNANGQWVDGPHGPCPSDQTCVEGECNGVCGPNQVTCINNTRHVCNSNGEWEALPECPLASSLCFDGECVVMPPSCDEQPMTCGSDEDESCCAGSRIPGGVYHRSNDSAYPATVSSFNLDRFEITVGRFRRFVEAYPAGSRPVAGTGAYPLIGWTGWDADWDASLPADQAALIAAVKCSSSYQTWTDVPGANESLPMNCITWYEAFAFCAWDGGRLPTEAEWNYGAAGGVEQRLYPWSVPPGSTVIDATYAIYGCPGDGSSGCTFSDIGAVGSRSPNGDGLWGQADLAGSMWEWNLDSWIDQYEPTCSNCVSTAPASDRVLRGGGWHNDASELRSGYRFKNDPLYRSGDVGGRCARTVDQQPDLPPPTLPRPPEPLPAPEPLPGRE